ncbi:MAG: alpha/beta hydrolase [Deltaproteobacteria bacterium]|nr:alpha/beta hydrolase [Deltaproteobacteria bacterium]
MEPTILRVPGADGIQLNVLEWSREGVPLLLLHGFANEAHIWDEFVPHVAPHYRVLALDLRGHGDSDWHPDAAYEYDDYVADLEALIDHLGLERVVLVAHSLGGRISMLYGGRHPEKLAGLVIVDSAPELDARGTTRISTDISAHRDPSFASRTDYEQMLVHNYPAAKPGAIRRMAQHELKQRDDGRFVFKMDVRFRGAVGAAAGGQDAQDAKGGLDAEAILTHHARSRDAMWEALRKLECPTLVVRGAASDFLNAEIADRMVDDELAKGQLAVVAQAGHSVMTDNPEAFAEAVGRFVLGE